MADLWNDMSIQFPRLIAEMEAAGVFDLMDQQYEHYEGESGVKKDLLDSMDLEWEDVMHLVDTAQATWDMIKINLVPDSHIAEDSQ